MRWLKSKRGKRCWEMVGMTMNGAAVILHQVDGRRGSSNSRVVSKERLQRDWLVEDEMGNFVPLM